MILALVPCFTFLWISPVRAETLAENLTTLRKQVVVLEQGLVEGSKSRQNAKKQVAKIKKLLVLQKQEQSLGQKRLIELEKTVQDLESRKIALSKKKETQQKSIRIFLSAIESSSRGQPSQFNEKIEAPRRKVLANLVDRGLKEVETLHADLVDAAEIETKIQEEKQQLAYLVQDLKEQEGILELNHQLQIDYLKKKRNEHLTQLESYRKLKTAEARVEEMIHDFNAHRELQEAVESERLISKDMTQSRFFQLKGRLSLPISDGKIISNFGRAYDSHSGLYIFKKGIEISGSKMQIVHAISSGKIAYAGEMPHYGQVVIIDHGDHFYSLCAHLGRISRKTSELVAAGDPIGSTGDFEAPLYFEIRARNVAVNPLQWLIN